MLTPEYLNSFSSGYLGMCDVLNEQIIRDVARRIAKTRKNNTDSRMAVETGEAVRRIDE